MERTTPNGEYNDIKQIKIIPPGCQTVYKYIITSNDLYFCYASTMTINVFYNKNFQIKCILNPSIEKFIKCLSFNLGKSNELAVYYEEEILIFNVETESIIERIKNTEVKFIEYNLESKLLILNKNQSLSFYDPIKKKTENIKTVDKVTAAKWYPFNGTDLAYATNKSVSYHSIKNKNRISGIDLEIKEGNFITELGWYTLDENYKYVLVGLNDGHIFLLDVMQSIIIMKFEKSQNEISSLIWLRHEPGTFISFSKGNGRVSYWNVSKKNYNEICKFSDSPVLYCTALSDISRVLLSLENGSIVVFDLKNRKSIFNLEPSHSETIFDLKYNPIQYGTFATCSYDATIKIWDVKENKIIWDLNVDKTINKSDSKKSVEDVEITHVYSLKWSPNDMSLIASGDSKGNLKIWSTTKQKLVSHLKLNTSNTNSDCQIIGIDWDKEDNLISTCTDSIYLSKFELGKLNLVKFFKSTSTLFQIKFDPFQTGQYAVACNDGLIRIYANENEKPTKTLTGHQKKVFGLNFNSKRLGIIASSSDDTKIGIWDIDKNTSFMLTGHTNKARHIVWLPDYSNILLTGSWDGSIKIWNIDFAYSIGEITENYSDVYGIDISPHHPFLLTSCSRDNSIRFFNVLTSSKKMTEFVLNFDKINLNSFGKENKILEERLKSCNSLDSITSADIISNYFFYHDGLKDFWDIIKVITKQKEYCDPDNRIFYVTDLYSVYQSKVQQLEFNYYSKNKIDYSIRKDDLLKEAIDLAAKIGDWEKFCELSIEANQWEKAIMAAPNVSLEYWRELTKKYAEYSHNSGKINSDTKFATLLSDEVQPALRNYIESGEYEMAKLIWLTRGNRNKNYTRNYNLNEIFNLDKETLNLIDNKLNKLSLQNDYDDGLFKTASTMAKEHLVRGFPIMAAASFISIKDVFNSLKTLVRTCELEIAFMVMKIFNDLTYEKEIMMGLFLKELMRGGIDNLKFILNKCISLDLKITLIFFLKHFKKLKYNVFNEYNLSLDELTQSFKSTGNEFLIHLINNEVNSCVKIFFTKTEELSNYFLKNKKLDSNLIVEVMNIIFYMKAIDFYSVENHQKLLIRLLIVSSFLDSLNKNTKSCLMYLQELNRIIKNNNSLSKLNDSELILLNFSISFIKGEKTKIDNNSVDINGFKNLIKDRINYNFDKDYVKIIEDFRKNENKNALKYNCDYLGYFYSIRDEVFPINIKNIVKSTLNGKIIKGKPTRINNNIIITQSEGLEWFKFVSNSPLIDEYQLFNPY